MSDCMKETWVKVIEYASMPYQGLSRKLRAGYSIQFDCACTGDCAPLSGDVIFELSENYLRVMIDGSGGEQTNMYLAWDKLSSIKTTGKPKAGK